MGLEGHQLSSCDMFFPPLSLISPILKKHAGLCNRKNKYDYLFIELNVLILLIVKYLNFEFILFFNFIY
jgi:hypothetical protein